MTEEKARKVWEIGSQRYQGLAGVPQRFLIGLASASIKDAWRSLVIEAYEAGQFALDDPNVHPDAEQAVRAELRRREEAERERRFQDALRRNRIRSIDELSIGDRVFVVLGGHYGEVVKKNRKTVRVKIPTKMSRYPSGYFEWKVEPQGLQWKHYNDVKDDEQERRAV